jgi:hypothetical protein
MEEEEEADSRKERKLAHSSFYLSLPGRQRKEESERKEGKWHNKLPIYCSMSTFLKRVAG